MSKENRDSSTNIQAFINSSKYLALALVLSCVGIVTYHERAAFIEGAKITRLRIRDFFNKLANKD